MDRFKSIESFVAVARCGSYSRAAKQLGVSRALMSRRIIELESRLGVRLLNRSTHRLSLTNAGENYLRNCEGILSDLEAAELSLIETGRTARGKLRVLTSQTFGVALLGTAAADFMRQYPDIDVHVVTTSLRQQAAELFGGGFDLALRTTALADSSLIARKIAPLEWFLVAAPEYIERHGQPRRLKDISDHRCLVTGIEPVQRWELESATGSQVIKVNGLPLANITTITRDMVVAGLGIALLPEYCIAEDIAAGRMIRLFPKFRGKRRWIYAVYQKERNLPLRTRLFMDFLRERFQAAR